MVKRINNDYDKYRNEMVKNDIDEQNKYYTFNQQENLLKKNREAAYNHLLDKQKNIMNDTNDLDIENKRLSYKFDTINKQPEVYRTIQPQQKKLASAQALNDVLNNKLELQKKTKELQKEVYTTRFYTAEIYHKREKLRKVYIFMCYFWEMLIKLV